MLGEKPKQMKFEQVGGCTSNPGDVLICNYKKENGYCRREVSPTLKDICGHMLIMSVPTSDIPQWDPTANSASGYEDFYKPQGSVEIRIDGFTKFARENEQRRSAVTYIRGLPWQISAYPYEVVKKNAQNDQSSSKFIALYLHCNYNSASTAWSCKSSKEIYRVLSQEEGIHDYVLSTAEPRTYNEKDSIFGYECFISIEELLAPEKGFIKGDTVILQVDVTADVPHGIQENDAIYREAYNSVFGSLDKNQLFSSSTHYQSDFVLMVQDKRVHVTKSNLSLHSEYFKEQFAKDVNCESAILLNIDCVEFVELLSIIHSTSRLVTVENVETVAKLAHIFKMKGILQQCEVVLMVNISKFGRIRTFLLSHWYGMEHLQAKCIDQLKIISGPNTLKEELEFAALKNEIEFAALDCRTKAILLDKIIESNPKSTAECSINVPASDQLKASNARSLMLMHADDQHQHQLLLLRLSQTVFLSWKFLAVYSEYFNTMFFGEFKEKCQEENKLKDVSYNDMLELLAVIYPCGDLVTEKNLEVVLTLADLFIMPEILERCKKVLKSSKKIERVLKLYLAQRYNFPDLQIEYANEYNSVKDVKKLKAEPEYEHLDDKSRSLIFDSITSVEWKYYGVI